MTASEAPLAGVRVDRRVMPHGQYRCILADPPWALAMAGQRKRAKEGTKPEALPYPTMTIEDICAMPVADFAAEDCHLWLWTTNQHLEDGFRVMRAWGFKYLAPVHWVKPTGMGNWFVHRSQTMLFGYRQKCRFPLARYRPNVFQTGDPKRHSEKPDASYELIEAVSPGPRLELFARRKRGDWHTWGNEVPCDVSMGHNASGKPTPPPQLPTLRAENERLCTALRGMRALDEENHQRSKLARPDGAEWVRARIDKARET